MDAIFMIYVYCTIKFIGPLLLRMVELDVSNSGS